MTWTAVSLRRSVIGGLRLKASRNGPVPRSGSIEPDMGIEDCADLTGEGFEMLAGHVQCSLFAYNT